MGLSIKDIEDMDDDVLLDKLVEVVSKNNWQEPQNDNDSVLYHMLRQEVYERMQARIP